MTETTIKIHPLISTTGTERRFCGWGGISAGASKQPKAPATAEGKLMSWSDPANWLTFEEAKAAMTLSKVKGIGYFTSNGDHPEMIPITVVDLDHCVESGVIVGDWQRAVVELANTLTVISPSGTGLHLIFLGVEGFCAPEITAVKGHELRGFECFSKAHHVRLSFNILRDVPLQTMTGELWVSLAALLPGWLDEVAAAEQAAAEAKAKAEKAKAPKVKKAERAADSGKLNDKQIGFVAEQFKERHPIESLLTSHGYSVATGTNSKGNVDVTRAGKDPKDGTSGDIDTNGIYWPFSSNDLLPKREKGARGYSAFDAMCHFDHGGDEQAAAWAVDKDLGLEMKPPGKGKGKADDRPTDDDLAERWSKLYPDTTYGVGEFRRYANGYWDEVDKQTAEGELFRIIREAKPEGVKPNSGILASVEKLARVMVHVKDEKWDRDPDLLVCRNGTLHIPSMELRDHSKADYLTSGVPYDYDATAECPEFLGAIRAAVPEAESFLQEFAGLALTTETKYEIAVWFQGVSGSGKSTIIGGLQAMLGSRVIGLGLAAIERSQFALAKLPGKTLAISTEQPALFLKASDVLNTIISGEVVTVERKYRDAVEIRPQVKLLWAMNDLPRVGDAGNGLFRRVKVVKFPNKIVKIDENLKARIALEAAGILNWALAGLLRLMDRGRFDIPACVTAATDKFQRENDVPAAFLAECCLLGAEKQAGGQQLYNAYKFWCLQTGHKAQSSTTLAADWERLGLERKRTMNGAVYHGVGVLTQWIPPPPKGDDGQKHDDLSQI